MQNTDKIIEDNHARLLERKFLHKSHGYDIDEERAFIIEKAGPLNGKILTIHHLVNPYQVVDELIRVLDPKGKLVLSDFNKRGFDLMDEIHAVEGRTHKRGNVMLLEIQNYLRKKDFIIRSYQTQFQEMAVACRATG